MGTFWRVSSEDGGAVGAPEGGGEGAGGFLRIGRGESHPGPGMTRRPLTGFDRLVGRAVFADADGVVGEDVE